MISKSDVSEAYDIATQESGDRYRVIRNRNYFRHRYSVVGGKGLRAIFTGSMNDCLRVSAELTTAYRDGIYSCYLQVLSKS